MSRLPFDSVRRAAALPDPRSLESSSSRHTAKARQADSQSQSSADLTIDGDSSTYTYSRDHSTTRSVSSPTSASLNWIESNMASQVSRLDVELQVIDMVQQTEPSLFGLRRKIAAALPQLGYDLDPNAKRKGRQQRAGLESSSSASAFAASIESEDGTGVDGPFQIVNPAARARGNLALPFGVSTPSHNYAKQTAKLERELQEREKEYEVQLLSRFETSELNMDVYTEQRTGEWVQRGTAAPNTRPAEALPRVFSPWDITVDTKSIIRRNKLRSYVELVDSTTTAKCPDCNIYNDREAGYRYGLEPCEACDSTGLVKMVYVVCVTLRQSRFLPLHLPLVHTSGWFQDTLRTYLHVPEQRVHPTTLRRKAMEAIRSSAYRVGLAHAQAHDARLLCVKATMQRRSCNSVVVLHNLNGNLRTFDVTDSGELQSGSSSSDSQGAIRIRETPGLTKVLNSYALVERSDGLFRLTGVDQLVEMTTRTTYKQYTIRIGPGAGDASGRSSPASMLASLPAAGWLSTPPSTASSPRLGLSPLGSRSTVTLPSSSTASPRRFNASLDDSPPSSATSETSTSARSFFSLGRLRATRMGKSANKGRSKVKLESRSQTSLPMQGAF